DYIGNTIGGACFNLYEVKSNNKERASLVGLDLSHGDRWKIEDHLEELALLANTAGAVVIDKIIQERNKIDPAYFIGYGKAKSISLLAQESKADLLIFDDDLSPAQVRNLERLSGKKILDRSGLILDIFARRAKTREARTQVELAQLNYLLPRLTRQWLHLSRQVGGIGTRGPGETQLEVDRRLIRKRIGSLTKELEKIKNQQDIRRQSREEIFKVALVGYTNVGKSTLLNALTQSEVFVEDRLFATLDATIRRLKMSRQVPILLIDTVGFIRKLPHHLVASFMSTLEEAKVADMLLHVVDVSHPLFHEQIAVVKDVLRQLQISDKPTIFVFNKVDKLEQRAFLTRLTNEYQPGVFVSATKGLFLEDLKREITKMSTEAVVEMSLSIDIQFSWIVSKIYELAEVLEIKYNDKDVELKIRSLREKLHAIKSMLEENTNGQHALSILEKTDKENG
ncbi:MAG: GTPase HflX, partial [bacterium]